jgi:hypothetical protein
MIFLLTFAISELCNSKGKMEAVVACFNILVLHLNSSGSDATRYTRCRARDSKCVLPVRRVTETFSSINDRRRKETLSLHCGTNGLEEIMHFYSRCRQETLRFRRLTPCDRPVVTIVSPVEGLQSPSGC